MAFTISASRDFLEGAGKESTAKDDPLGCLGDMGWACARMGKLAYGVLNPVSAQVIHSEATAENVPVDITAVRISASRFTPSTRLASRNDGSGWFLFRF